MRDVAAIYSIHVLLELFGEGSLLRTRGHPV